jgi:hypothetical protein
MQKTKYNVPLGLIEHCIKENALDALYYAYKLSHTSKQRVIKDFTYDKAAFALNCSKSTAHNQIKVILKLKLATLQQNGNLAFLGVNKLKTSKRDIIVQVPIKESKKEQIIAFRYAVLYRNLHLQAKQISFKSRIVEKARTSFGKIKKSHLKIVAKNGGMKMFMSKYNENVNLSNVGIGKLFNRSATSGKKYQKLFNYMGLIESKSNWKKICKCKKEDIYEVRFVYDKYYITYYKGYAWLRLPNIITPLA